MVPRMRMRLRQVALVAADLPPVEAAITDELGVELDQCLRANSHRRHRTIWLQYVR